LQCRSHRNAFGTPFMAIRIEDFDRCHRLKGLNDAIAQSDGIDGHRKIKGA